ncbi:MAG: YfiR family protein [Candidatus Endonucleobacter bathymodioli]|uniref:YfiR family protein n=1 Tax=Candidatus Endonucleibacter bathymodioli TaxID=539814 RepID=A0AA90NUH6_9GAMM|nr:YfiR family protein [Candidatus Endonucleobacter bathymodioli]
MKIIKFITSLKLTILILCALGSNWVIAASDNRVKAAIIFKITYFVQWSKIKIADSVLDLCVLGDDSLYSELKTTQGKLSRGSKVNVRKIDKLQESDNYCEMIFIGDDFSMSTSEVAEMFKTSSVLLVSDRAHFAKDGGMLQIIERGGRIRFTVNMRPLKASGLSIGSQFLSLAKVIQ